MASQRMKFEYCRWAESTRFGMTALCAADVAQEVFSCVDWPEVWVRKCTPKGKWVLYRWVRGKVKRVKLPEVSYD